MTTEASSETEVKEKAEESAAQPDQSEKATEETQEVANAEGEVKEKEKGKEGKGISRYLPTWLKKQKSQSQVQFLLKTCNAAVVILRSSHNCLSWCLCLIIFFFSWLMKTSPTEEASPTEETVDKVSQEEEGHAPEVNGHAEEGEEKEAVKSEQVEDKEAESHSNASADTEVLVVRNLNS